MHCWKQTELFFAISTNTGWVNGKGGAWYRATRKLSKVYFCESKKENNDSLVKLAGCNKFEYAEFLPFDKKVTVLIRACCIRKRNRLLKEITGIVSKDYVKEVPNQIDFGVFLCSCFPIGPEIISHFIDDWNLIVVNFIFNDVQWEWDKPFIVNWSFGLVKGYWKSPMQNASLFAAAKTCDIMENFTIYYRYHKKILTGTSFKFCCKRVASKSCLLFRISSAVNSRSSVGFWGWVHRSGPYPCWGRFEKTWNIESWNRKAI